MATYVTIPNLQITALNSRAPAMPSGPKRIVFRTAGDFAVSDEMLADKYLEGWAHFGRYLPTKRAMDIACFGDSLTNGAGASAGNNYPGVLDRDKYDYERAVFNGGYNGGTSTVIKGVFDANTAQHPAVRIIWAGNNNPEAGEQETRAREDVAYMLATNPHPRYLVIGNICGKWGVNYEAGGAVWENIAARNTYWAGLHGAKFLDVFTVLRSSGNGGTQDNADVAKGSVPTSLCSDEIHLNDAGYAVVANAVFAKLLELGY